MYILRVPFIIFTNQRKFKQTYPNLQKKSNVSFYRVSVETDHWFIYRKDPFVPSTPNSSVLVCYCIVGCAILIIFFQFTSDH